LFAHLTRILKLDRLHLRGISGAQDEFLLAARPFAALFQIELVGPPTILQLEDSNLV
jgi:hypothetical protein